MNPREFCREPGFQSTIILTYSFDPLFFERVALPDLWAAGTGDILVLADQQQVAESLQRWSEQLHHLGKSYQLNAAATSGAFHPKLMIRLGREAGAIWLSSGNLTFGGWGANQELCCCWKFGPNLADTGDWIYTLLDRIRSWCPDNLAMDAVQRAQNIPWIRSLEDQSAIEPAAFLVSDSSLSLARLLQKRWAGRRFDQVRIITGSTDKSGAMLAWLNREFGVREATIIIDKGRVSFCAEEIAALPMQVDVVHFPSTSPIHAKFYWFDGPLGSAAIVGSANCSAAAWLQPPSGGGNNEAVAVHDKAESEDFEAILKLFESSELKPAVLPENLSALPDKVNTGPAFHNYPEINWHAETGEIRARFKSDLPSDAVVELLFVNGHSVQLREASISNRLWVAELTLSQMDARTLFGTVSVRSNGQEIGRFFKWINDVRELNFASKARRMTDPILNLARAQNLAEQKKMVAQLQQIALALISEPNAFPDPLVHTEAKEKKETEEQPEQAEAVNPAELIKSMNDVKAHLPKGKCSATDFSLSLAGIMRALFDVTESSLEDESEAADEPDKNGDDKKKGEPKKKDSEHLPRVEIGIANKKHLRSQLEEFISRMGNSDFANSATATQLIQAAAFPLAVAFRGEHLGWVEADQAQSWIVRVCDLLFVRVYGEQKAQGLLAYIRKRYAAEDKELDFLKVVGDGTLWLALLSSIALVHWDAGNGPVERALALRAVWQAQDLIKSADAGRMGVLLRLLDAQRAHAVVVRAPAAIERLQSIEVLLAERQAELLAEQMKIGLRHQIGDLLWRKPAGWAEARTEAACNEKCSIYLHKRAQEVPVTGGYYINVTKAELAHTEIEEKIGKLDALDEAEEGMQLAAN